VVSENPFLLTFFSLIIEYADEGDVYQRIV
jgi:serine/threonine protein kinase